jgi:elongation factor Ts
MEVQLEVSATMVKELRDQCGAGVMECRNALMEAGGSIDKALQILKEKGLTKAAKKAERATTQGLIEAYIHTGGRIGAMVELSCESDFVARTADFKGLAHDVAMQVAAVPAQYISKDEVPEGVEVEAETDCLLLQPFIKNPDSTIQDIIIETIAKVGENIKLKRFVRFDLGD